MRLEREAGLGQESPLARGDVRNTSQPTGCGRSPVRMEIGLVTLCQASSLQLLHCGKAWRLPGEERGHSWGFGRCSGPWHPRDMSQSFDKWTGPVYVAERPPCLWLSDGPAPPPRSPPSQGLPGLWAQPLDFLPPAIPRCCLSGGRPAGPPERHQRVPGWQHRDPPVRGGGPRPAALRGCLPARAAQEAAGARADQS